MKKVLFYYPQHFNRTKEGTNPFFDRMLDLCERNGIKYDLFEEPDGGTDRPRNCKARQADIFFWFVTSIRKVVSLIMPSKSFYQREKYVARFFNILSLGKYRYDRYITISGSMYHLFANLNPRSKVFDMQHGVVYKEHPTFFENRNLKPQFRRQNLHFIFWGKGYEENFVRGEEEILKGRTHVLGYPVDLDRSHKYKSGMTDHSCQNSIVVSMQFTHSVSYDELEKLKDTLRTFLKCVANLDVKVLLKHHPRYNNCIDIQDLLHDFDYVELTSAPLDELIDSTFLHVTFFSTTTFEYAQFGVPTYFLTYNEKELSDTLFYGEYNYPLYLGKSISEVVNRLRIGTNYLYDSKEVYKWYQRFYTSFDDTAFLKLIE